MNKININFNKKIISSIVLSIVLLLLFYSVYFIDNKIKNYKNEVMGDYTKLAQLENEKTILNTYNKISSKDSLESMKIKKYILSNDRKSVLGLINELEKYTKKVGLTENNDSPIVSISPRENAELSKYNANDLVLNIKVSGSDKNIDNFLNLINNLPLVSYIEKIDIKFDSIKNKNNVNMILVIYQKK